jgi:hypothetical protein
VKRARAKATAKHVARVHAAAAERDIVNTLPPRRIKTYREGPAGETIDTGREILLGDLVGTVLPKRTEVETAAKRPKARKCKDCNLYVVKRRAGVWPHRCAKCKRANVLKEKREYAKAYRAKHPETREKIRAYNRSYYAANAKKTRDRARIWNEKNADKKRATDARYRKDHPEVKQAAQARYRERQSQNDDYRKKNRERARTWRAANPEKAAEKDRLSNARRAAARAAKL